ncbi:MAG: hypothetical protein P4M06_08800, partial [Pandoraea sp.]
VQQGLKTRFPDRPRTTGLLASGRPFEIARNRVWQNEPNPSGSSRICPSSATPRATFFPFHHLMRRQAAQSEH